LAQEVALKIGARTLSMIAHSHLQALGLVVYMQSVFYLLYGVHPLTDSFQLAAGNHAKS